MKKNIKICTIFGTRPEIIKLSPLLPKLNEHFKHTSIYTGQHFSRKMSDIFFADLSVDRPDIDCSLKTSNLDILAITLLHKLEELNPDIVLVYGDTASSLAGAKVAKKLGAYLVHIEAGLRCFEPIKEEIYRIEIDRLSDLLLCPTNLNKYFLCGLGEKIEGRIEVIGSLIVDAYKIFSPKFIKPSFDGFILFTLHREENVDTETLFSIMAQIYTLNETIVFPIHPRTQQKLLIKLPENIKVIDPVGYFELGGLLKQATLVLTDSGGIQEEALMAKTPCITVRKTTERQETVYLGANTIFSPNYGCNLSILIKEIMEKGFPEIENPYGDGNTASKIIEILGEI